MSARRSKEEVSSGESDSSSESDSYDVPDPYGDGQPSWHFLGERRAAKIVRDYLVQQAYSDRESAETSEPIEYRVKRFEHDEDPPSDWEFDDEDQVHRWLILAYGDAEAIVSFLDSVEGYILRRGSGDVSRFAGYTMDPYIQLAHIMGLGDWKRSEFKRSDAMSIFSDRVKNRWTLRGASWDSLIVRMSMP